MSGSEQALRVGRGELPVGTVFDGRYRSTGVLGRGGFSIVYDGVQLQLDRRVAIKVMKQGLEHEAIKRFFREAKTAARIQHPNVVQIFDYGIMGSIPYIVMEIFDGADLEEHVTNHGPLESARLLPLFSDCLGGLAVAHAQGIVHKDLKPCNLVLTDPGKRGSLKIIDFGTAALSEGQERLTRTGAICGTAMYMAPEYVQHRAVTPALDVYQMGLVLVEVLTGRPCITAETPYECLVQHISGELAVPAPLREGVLGEIVNKSLALDPRDRFQDAAQMREALLRAQPHSISVELPKIRLSSGVRPAVVPDTDEMALGADVETRIDVQQIYDSGVTQFEVTPATTVPFATTDQDTRQVKVEEVDNTTRVAAVGIGIGTLTLMILGGLAIAAAIAWSVWMMQVP